MVLPEVHLVDVVVCLVVAVFLLINVAMVFFDVVVFVVVLLLSLSIDEPDVSDSCFCDVLLRLFIIDVGFPFPLLNEPLFLVDVALDALLDDDFVVSSSVVDDLDALDVNSP